MSTPKLRLAQSGSGGGEKKINLSVQQERNTVASKTEGYEKCCKVFLVYYFEL